MSHGKEASTATWLLAPRRSRLGPRDWEPNLDPRLAPTCPGYHCQGATGGLRCPLRAALPAASTGPGPSPRLQAIAPHLPLSSLSTITFLVNFMRCSNADCLSYPRIFIYFKSFQQQVRLIATDCKQANLTQTDLLSTIKANTKHTHLLQLLLDKPLACSPLSTIQPPEKAGLAFHGTCILHRDCRAPGLLGKRGVPARSIATTHSRQAFSAMCQQAPSRC